MKNKLFLLTLAALLFGWSGAFAEPINGDADTLWTKYISGITDLKFHPSGETVILAQKNYGLFEIDAQTGAFIRDFEYEKPNKPNFTHWGLDVSPDGNFIAVIDDSARVVLIDYQTGKQIKRLDKYATDCYFQGSRLFCLTDMSNLIYNFWVYDLQTGISKGFNEYFNESNEIDALGVSPDGKYLAIMVIYGAPGNWTAAVVLYLSLIHI